MALGVWLGSVVASGDARASNRYLEFVPEETAAETPASRYANLTNRQAYAEVQRRGIPYRRVTEAPGVRAPIRLTGPLHGVTIHSSLPEAERADSPYEILDARLALALDDLCRILAVHDVVEVVHFTMYRPGGVSPKAQDLTRHPAGLAIDLGAIKKSNGEWLSVGIHWAEQIGAKTCGEGARKLKPRRGRELVSILCEAADQRLFHYMLSPHFNEAHHDHFHLEIKPHGNWFLVN